MIVIKRPIITEKTMNLAKEGLYTFEVDKDANKLLVAKIVAEKFKVKVVSVKTIKVKGQIKSQKRVRRDFKIAGYKKALVQLKKGDKIAMFETPVEDKNEVVVTTGEGEPQQIREKKDLLGRTKLKIEKSSSVGASPTTQRKVITGK